MKIHQAIQHYLRRLGLFMLGLSLLRILFFAINSNAFPSKGFGSVLHALASGTYFDFIYSFYALGPIMLLCVFGSYLLRFKSVRVAESIYFGSIALLTTVLACINAAYFPFVKSHIGADLLFFLDGDNNISMWTYIFQYWYLLLVCLALPLGLWYFSGKTSKKTGGYKLIGLIQRLVFLGLLFLLVRGGLRLRPISSLDAVLFAPTSMETLVMNPEMVFIESFSSKDDLVYDDTLDIRHIERSNRQYYGLDANSDSVVESDFLAPNGKRPNIVLIILESFGKEFTGGNSLGLPSKTPFLDSIKHWPGHVLTCNNAFANGQKSKDALPALMAGIPGMFKNGFITSQHATKDFPSLPALLKKEGYHSSFYHGANNGSMGFRNFLLANGLNEYKGVDEYPNAEADHDGHWGIFDEPYLDYFRRELNEKPEPFFASVFTLSSHDPYAIPKDYKKVLPKEKLKLHRSVRYTDMALRKFMKAAIQEDWAANTVFIITADHSSLNQKYRYQAGTGKYEVPLIFYTPARADTSINFEINKPTQHVDLLPTILDLINYPDTVTCLGKSALIKHNKSQTLVFRDGNAKYALWLNWELKVVGEKAVELYNLKTDPDRLRNIIKSQPKIAKKLHLDLKKQESNLAKKLLFNQFF